MVRLTAEMVRTAPQGLNCLGDWELDLRGRRLVDIAALAPVAGRYDAIDLSRNFLPALSGFPFAPRLRHLHVPRNRIAAIGPGFADAVPALESLLLTDNGWQANGDGDRHRDGGGRGGVAGGGEGEDMEDDDGGGRANGGAAGGADGVSKASG